MGPDDWRGFGKAGNGPDGGGCDGRESTREEAIVKPIFFQNIGASDAPENKTIQLRHIGVYTGSSGM